MLSNAQSLRNKSEELHALVRFSHDFRDTCILAFTETWFSDLDSDSDWEINGFGKPIRLDRDAETTGKSTGYIRSEYISGMAKILKLHLLGEDQEVKAIRKINMPVLLQAAHFPYLLRNIGAQFNLPEGDICLFYKDTCGDLVMLMSIEDMKIAQMCMKENTLPIYVQVSITFGHISRMAKILKLHLLGEDQKVKVIRKMSTPSLNTEKGCPYDNLVRKVKDLFCFSENQFTLFYKDEDGDMVMFTSIEEMMIGMRRVIDDTFRIYIQVRSVATVLEE